MPGVPGRGGPPPKRTDQRRRRNKPDVPVDHAPALPAEPPPAEEGWHPIAARWYEALAVSGQSVFYQASDWATAYMIAENMSRDLKPRPIGVHPETGEPVMAKVAMNGSALSAYLRAMTVLLVTEGDRRRSRLELARGSTGEGDDGVVTELDAYRRRLAG